MKKATGIEKTFTRTRIAPTPSGYLHLGNILSFATTTAVARKTGARILLRIDDLDRPRIHRAYVQDIFDTLHFLDIPWDEGPRNYEEYEKEYSQLYRLPLYREALERLKANGQVFACDCSRRILAKENPEGVYPGTCRDKKLSLDRQGLNWRLYTDPTADLNIKTMTGRDIHTTLPPSMQYFIVKKKDGFPAYQLASVIDDLHFGVDLVVRGEDLWPSTLAQQFLARRLEDPRFCGNVFVHHPLITDTNDRKLSKSAGDTSIHFLRGQGQKPAEIYTTIGRMAGAALPVSDWQSLGEAMIRSLHLP